MDDVGQTLLNWASAFGTQEMVNYNRFEFNNLIYTEGVIKKRTLFFFKLKD